MRSKKAMKSSVIRKIIVRILDQPHEVDIDESIFEDVYMEAATRVVEKSRKKRNFQLGVILECYDKNKEKISDEHYVYNTYFVLINAGMYKKAELLREKFKKSFNVDLQEEPIRGHSGKPPFGDK